MLTKRPQKKVQTFLQIASEVASLGTCNRLQVGCVITDHRGFILSTGYNGAPAGMKHCSEEGCSLDERTGQCVRSIHAEANAIISAATRGISLQDSEAFVTTRPCIRCTQMLIQAGVRKIVYEQEYTSEAYSFFEAFTHEAGIEVIQFAP